MLNSILFISILISQSESPVTNSGESFQDPFSNPNAAEVQQPAENPLPSESPNLGSPVAEPPKGINEIPAPSTTLTPEPTLEPAPAPSLTPTPAPAATPPSTFAPPPSEEPVMEPELAPPPSMLPPAPKNDFSFPETEEFQGPIDRNVVRTEFASASTRIGTYNLGLGLGAGFNMNKRHQQIHMEVNGGYRLYQYFEVGGIVSARFVKDKIIGMIAMAKGFYPLTGPSSLRMDFAYGGGLGWSLRAAHSTFNEGRLTVRLQSELLAYPFPKFAITLMTAFETFLLAAYSDDTRNLMSNGGPPSQLILTLGTRWEF
jgi:hypothetical protein